MVSEMDIIRQKFDNIKNGIKSYMKKMTYKRGVGGNELHTNIILSGIG